MLVTSSPEGKESWPKPTKPAPYIIGQHNSDIGHHITWILTATGSGAKLSILQWHTPAGVVGVSRGLAVGVGPGGKRITAVIPNWACWQCIQVQHKCVKGVHRRIYKLADASIARWVTEWDMITWVHTNVCVCVCVCVFVRVCMCVCVCVCVWHTSITIWRTCSR